MDKIETTITKGVDQILPKPEGLENKMRSGKKLRVYHGVDPTGQRLHIGHSIGLAKLQQFADLGHEAILLFGTGTVLVGDPSQRSTARSKITQEEINKNIKTWKKQAGKIIDFEKVVIKQNADWLLKLSLKDIINIASNVTAIQLFKRDMFQRRLKQGDTVWYHETMYPLLQGYDSVAMDVDLEIGGTDQTFNMLIGRELQKKMNNREKFVLTTPMIVGTNGQQMSKTTGNCVWLDDSPNDMYGKIMSIPDSIVDSYFELLTDLDSSKIRKEKLSEIEIKKRLAKTVTTRFHNEDKAKQAQSHFEKTVQNKEISNDTQTISVSGKQIIVDFIVINKLAPTKSEAKRLVKQGAVDVDDKTITDPKFTIEPKDGTIIRVGKHRVVRISND